MVGLELGFALMACGFMPVWSMSLTLPGGVWWFAAKFSPVVAARCCKEPEETESVSPSNKIGEGDDLVHGGSSGLLLFGGRGGVGEEEIGAAAGRCWSTAHPRFPALDWQVVWKVADLVLPIFDVEKIVSLRSAGLCPGRRPGNGEGATSLGGPLLRSKNQTMGFLQLDGCSGDRRSSAARRCLHKGFQGFLYIFVFSLGPLCNFPAQVWFSDVRLSVYVVSPVFL